MTNMLVPQPTQRTNTTNMGASQGKSKKEQKEEAREWARTKENEIAQLYAQNTELRNQILMMQEDMRALRDMLKGQQTALNESVKQMNERMTEMENDVKVVPFCHLGGDNFTIGVRVMSLSRYKKIYEELNYVKFEDVKSITHNLGHYTAERVGPAYLALMKASYRNFDYELALKKHK